MAVSENGKYGKLQIMDWNDIWHVSFLCYKYFCNPSVYVPLISQNFVSFPVQTALGVQLGFMTH